MLGVLIALGASQLLDAWQWRQQIKQEKLIFENELLDSWGNAYVRIAVEPCLAGRVEQITAQLNQPGTRWQAVQDRLDFGEGPKDFPTPYDPPFHQTPIVSEGWSNALANGAVNHLPSDMEMQLALAYADARRLDDYEHQERQAAARLAFLGTDRELSAENRIAILQEVGVLSDIGDEISVDSRQVINEILAAGLDFRREDLRSLWDQQAVQGERKIRGSCVTEPQLQKPTKT